MNHILTKTGLLLLCASLWAQDNLITLNAVVRDRKGAFEKTISASDLEFTDDGEKRNVRLIQVDSGELIENGKRSPAEPLRRLRLVTLVFESMDNEQRRLAKRIVAEMMKEDKGSGNLYSVWMISNQLSLLAQYTSNEKAILEAVDIATSGAANTRFVEVHRPLKAKLESQAGNRQSLTLESVTGANRENDAALQGYLARLSLGMMNDASLDGAEGTRRTLTFLTSLASGLKTHPGRKAMGYLSWGLIVPPNLDVLFESLQGKANRAGVTFYPFDCRGVLTSRQGEAVINSTQNNGGAESAGLENRSSANINALDNATEGLRYNPQAAMRTLADATGGTLMSDTNDPRRVIRDLLGDLQSYIEVVYDPAIKDYNGQMRKTTFKLANKDLRVRGRDGYLALTSEQENLLPFEIPMLKSLSEPVLPRDVEFRSGMWRVRSMGDRVQATVAVEVPFEKIGFATDQAKGLYGSRLTLLAQVKDQSGKVVEKFARDLPLRGKLDLLERLKSSNFNFREKVLLAPGRYTLETVVTDQLSGKSGARRSIFVAAPSAGTLGVSSVTLVRNFEPGVKDLAPDDPYQFQGGRITPTLNTNLKIVKGAKLALFFIVYSGDKTGASPEATIQYLKDGDVVGNAALPLPKPDAEGRIPYVLSSPLDSMTPGVYEVKVTVKQGNATASDSVLLTIGG